MQKLVCLPIILQYILPNFITQKFLKPKKKSPKIITALWKLAQNFLLNTVKLPAAMSEALTQTVF